MTKQCIPSEGGCIGMGVDVCMGVGEGGTNPICKRVCTHNQLNLGSFKQ